MKHNTRMSSDVIVRVPRLLCQHIASKVMTMHDAVYMPQIPDRVETDRLLLRPPRMGDGSQVNTAIRESFEKLNIWMPWAHRMPTIAESEAFAREGAAHYRNREGLPMLIFRKTDGVLLGSSGMHSIDWEVPRMEIGYWLRTSMEHQGYMTEAVIALTELCLHTLHANRIEIRCDALNHASASVAVRAGYALEVCMHNHRRNIHGALSDTLIYTRFP
jgi:ribosomal-protein-serine acetyltransferase